MKRNAIILAAGYSSRFWPLSEKQPKGLTVVKGEILVERQIKQLNQAGIDEIILVCGYKKEHFFYLKDKFQIHLLENKEYSYRNNHSSIYTAREFLGNTYICSSDNYFTENPFVPHTMQSYYAAQYANGPTDEWCLQTDADGRIVEVCIGGSNAWYMMGHAYWNEEFSNNFRSILEAAYDKKETKSLLWESIYQNHIAELALYIKKYPPGTILEFDTVAELRAFDPDYHKYNPD